MLFASQFWSQALKIPALFNLLVSRLQSFYAGGVPEKHYTVFKRAISVVCICVFMYLLKKKVCLVE